MTTIRKEMPAPQLDKDEFKRRYRERFYDPAFDSMQVEIDRLAEIAWDGYENSRKSPRTERAGEGFADPDYQLAIEWRETSRRVADAQRRQHDPSSPPCILLINGATRSEHTCPGESSKTWRLVAIAREIFAREADIEIQLLDLSRRPPSTAGSYIRARPASPRLCRSATGHAHAIPITSLAR